MNWPKQRQPPSRDRVRWEHAALAWLVTVVTFSSAAIGSPVEGDLPLDEIQLPEGFVIETFATDVPDARSMARADDGTIFVGSRRSGDVIGLRDTDGDFRVDQRAVIATGLNMPNGLAFRDGSLWLAEVHRILRFDRIESNWRNSPDPVVLRDDLPTERHHGWKYIAFGPDGKLYVPVGAPCNICDEPDPYATLLRMNADGSEQEVFARGIRNTVGFDWHPETGHLWFSDNGRDMMGDDLPADELNVITESGQHFGYPGCHATGIVDPDLGKPDSCRGKVLPALDLGPHVAALAVKFHTGKNFPDQYRGKLFIAEHGSWNRTQAAGKTGFRVMTVDVAEDGTASNYAVFAEGWLREDNKSWGRPVDLLELPDGSLLLSDDGADAIYRIYYRGSESAAP